MLTLIRMEAGVGGKKDPSRTSFFSVTSAKLKLAPEAVWIFVLTLLLHSCKIWSPHLVPAPDYWAWTKTTLQKKQFFWASPYKIEYMITSLT